MLTKQQVTTLTYILIGVALGSVLLTGFGIFEPATMTAILGLTGFAGIAGLRTFIEEQGWKTYLASGIGALASSLLLAGIIDYDLYVNFMKFMAPLTGVAMTHGFHKKQRNAEDATE